MVVHSVFDGLALLAAVLVFWLVPVPPESVLARAPWQSHPFYIAIASIGMTLGAFLFGSLNLWLTGIDGFGRSIEGGLAGAIIGVELVKRSRGIASSTGLRFAAPLAAAIVVGRIGCYLAGLDDMTYGTPTSLPWGADFGDGIPRHPVQLYESLTMAVFLAAFLWLLRRGHPLATRTGFYLFVGVYAGQRFVWEFLKPYGTVIGPFNLFHLLSVVLVLYAFIYGRREMLSPCTTRTNAPPLRA